MVPERAVQVKADRLILPRIDADPCHGWTRISTDKRFHQLPALAELVSVERVILHYEWQFVLRARCASSDTPCVSGGYKR